MLRLNFFASRAEKLVDYRKILLCSGDFLEMNLFFCYTDEKIRNQKE